METALYLPVKRFLENLGFTVKGEVGGCDLVALSADDPPIVVIGELKLSFNLELVLQAVDRAAACDEVWMWVMPCMFSVTAVATTMHSAMRLENSIPT